MSGPGSSAKYDPAFLGRCQIESLWSIEYATKQKIDLLSRELDLAQIDLSNVQAEMHRRQKKDHVSGGYLPVGDLPGDPRDYGEPTS